MASPWHLATVLISVLIKFSEDFLLRPYPKIASTFFALKVLPKSQWGHCCGFFCGIKVMGGRHKANHFNPSRSTVHQHQHAYCQTTHFKVQKTTHNPPGCWKQQQYDIFWRGFKHDANLAWKDFLGCWRLLFFSASVLAFIFIFLHLYLLIFYLYFCIWWRCWRLLLDAGSALLYSQFPRSLGVDLGPARLKLGDFCNLSTLPFLILHPFSLGVDPGWAWNDVA